MKALTSQQITQFIEEGYVRIDHAFSNDIAQAARSILWNDTGCNPDDPSTWTRPVIRLNQYGQDPFVQAANTPILHAAFNQLTGNGKWVPRQTLGTFPVRFPSYEDPGDDGWHVDASFPGNDPENFMKWRINIFSKGRGLLMLFLFSDVEANDAPTRIRAGSHLDVSKILEPKGEKGMSFMELAEMLETTSNRKEVYAIGKAGTVYLCHPFIVHAAQPHRGKNPRFLAQPPLAIKGEFTLDRPDHQYAPVVLAIRKGLGLKEK